MKKFLIVKPSSLGDILHAFPAANALARETGARLDWVVLPAFADLLRYLPCVDKVIPFERKKMGSFLGFPGAFFRLLPKLREEKYESVIDLQGLMRSAIIGRLARSGVYAGPENPKEGIAKIFYGRRLSSGKAVHAVEKNNSFISSFLGREDEEFDFNVPVVKEFSDGADALLREAAPRAASGENRIIAIAAGARWTTKQWSGEFFGKVADELSKKNGGDKFSFVFLGSEEDAKSSLAGASFIKGFETAVLCGKTSVGMLVELIRRAGLLICNDSGPMHIAAILKVPVLAFFGPTDPDLTGPYSKSAAVMQSSLSCIKCFKRYCGDMKCHSEISPALAAEKAYSLIRKEQPTGAVS